MRSLHEVCQLMRNGEVDHLHPTACLISETTERCLMKFVIGDYTKNSQAFILVRNGQMQDKMLRLYGVFTITNTGNNL
jgi:hypothetical protein